MHQPPLSHRRIPATWASLIFCLAYAFASIIAHSHTSAVAAEPQTSPAVNLGVQSWLEQGFRGQGVKVAVLDSGFRGYGNYLGKGLPTKVQTHSFRKDGNLQARDSQHGILCGEVIHTLAPDAELFFANWEPNQPASFLEAVRWARAQGVQVISCSCIMPNWSDGEGGGAVHEELARLLGSGKNAGDIVFFGCAGNTAKRHWQGRFQANAKGFHEWTKGQVDNDVRPWGRESVAVELYCRPGATYEVLVHDKLTGDEVARSTSHCQEDRCSAAARFQPKTGHDYTVRLRLVNGEPGPFHMVVLQGELATSLSKGSICFPGDGRLVMSVGAVDRNGQRQSYSACGPNSPLPKPDLVAPVPVPSHVRSHPFAGTSAATPQAAGLAALLWSRQPKWDADSLRQALRASARDLGPRGHDSETGYGLIQLSDLNVEKVSAAAR